MAKAKFKIGTLVQADTGAGEKFGRVTAVVTKADGYSYQLDDSEEGVIGEEMVTAAFRPIVARKVQSKKVVKTKSAKKAKSADADAATVQ